MGGLLGRPVGESWTEAVRQDSGLVVLWRPARPLGGERLADPVSEHERIGTLERPRRGEDFCGAAEERRPVFARASPSFERGGHPDAIAPIDLGPHTPSHLAPPLSR